MKNTNIKYIGICGHRGSGKNTMAYLIANTLEYILTNEFIEEKYYNKFKQWCDEIIKDESCVSSSQRNKVYIESFSDDLKLYINLLTGIPIEHMYEDSCKENVAINLKDLSEVNVKDITNKDLLITREKLFELRNTKKISQITSDLYITLGDFILYFGYDVMQRFFGANFWVKSLRKSEDKWQSNWNNEVIYKIYSDVKTECERDYIKDHGGVIIKVVRPDHKKSASPLSKDIDFKEDAVINSVEGGLYDLRNDIYRISMNILLNNLENFKSYAKENN